MQSLRRNFRRWWQVPRRAGDPHVDRRVTFLELFYDLVYVVLIAEISHALSQDVTLAGFGTFVFLFVLVWWAWINGTIYHDLHGQNDVRTRVFTFMQMFAVAAMAVFVHNAVGDGSKGFALSYAAFILILTYMWWRTGVHDPDHRPLSQPYSLVFLVTVLIFAFSVFADTPLRYYLWGIALLLNLTLPLVLTVVSRNNPQARAQHEIAISFSPAAVERFGLFTIIVLGEVIVGVVQGVVGVYYLNWTVGATAGLGMLIAIGVWWIYFDYVSHRLPLIKSITNYVWGYLHLPMTIGIAATGAAVLNVVEHTGEHLPSEVRWLLVASVSIALISIALLMRTIQVPDEHQRIYYIGSKVTLTCGIIIPLLGFSSLETIPLLIVLLALMLTPVFYGLKAWIKTLGTSEGAPQ
jgi:low temperature requirement protein LtrA